MRITVHIPDSLAKEMKVFADNEHRSVSSVVSDALQHYIAEKRKRHLGMMVLQLAGKTKISGNVHEEIENTRMDSDDRP